MKTPLYHLFSEARLTDEAASACYWQFVLQAADQSVRLDAADIESDVPLDRAELLAVVRGLEALNQPSRVTLVTPSRYVHHGLKYGLADWREAGWQWESFGQMTPIKHEDLWRRVDQALTIHRVRCSSWRPDAAHLTVPAPKSAQQVLQVKTRSESLEDSSPNAWQAARKHVASWLLHLGQRIAPRELVLEHS